MSQVWFVAGCWSVIPAWITGGWGEGTSHEFEANLGYTVRQRFKTKQKQSMVWPALLWDMNELGNSGKFCPLPGIPNIGT